MADGQGPVGTAVGDGAVANVSRTRNGVEAVAFKSQLGEVALLPSLPRPQEYASWPRRANWKGYLRLSLVSCPIALFPATSESEKVRFNQLNKNTGNRIRYVKVDAETGDEVDGENIIKGYQVSKGHYIEITDEDLEAVSVESTRTIDIDQFVPREEIDDLYNSAPTSSPRKVRSGPMPSSRSGRQSRRRARWHLGVSC